MKNKFLRGIASAGTIFPRLRDYPSFARDPIPPLERAGRKIHARNEKIAKELRATVNQDKKI